MLFRSGHALKDPNITVAYHTKADAELAATYADYGVSHADFANPPIVVEDDLEKIVAAIEE